MGLLPSTITFPETGTYVRWFDHASKGFKFARLMEKASPLVYPRRLEEVQPGAKLTNMVSFKDLNPSSERNHRYLLYLGLGSSFYWYIWHPFDVRTLKWDVDPPDDLDSSDLVGWVSAEQSPIDAPTVAIWVEPDRYPALNALNVGPDAAVAEVMWYGAKYLFNEALTAEEINGLESGRITFLPISFGGEF